MYICKNEFIICVPIYSSACCWKPRIISHDKFYYSNENRPLPKSNFIR